MPHEDGRHRASLRSDRKGDSDLCRRGASLRPGWPPPEGDSRFEGDLVHGPQPHRDPGAASGVVRSTPAGRPERGCSLGWGAGRRSPGHGWASAKGRHPPAADLGRQDRGRGRPASGSAGPGWHSSAGHLGRAGPGPGDVVGIGASGQDSASGTHRAGLHCCRCAPRGAGFDRRRPPVSPCSHRRSQLWAAPDSSVLRTPSGGLRRPLGPHQDPGSPLRPGHHSGRGSGRCLLRGVFRAGPGQPPKRPRSARPAGPTTGRCFLWRDGDAAADSPHRHRHRRG